MANRSCLIFRMCLIAFAYLLPVGVAHAAEHAVASADDIDEALERARPGDVLVMRDGTWTDQEVHFAARGTADAPITLRPQTPGGVVLTGSSELLISGEHLVVDGLHLRGGTPDTSSHVVQFRGKLGEAEHCRLTNTVIDSYNPPDPATRYTWVSLYGRHNRVDHCRFRNHAHDGVTLVAWLDSEPAHHRIDHNHFVDRPAGEGNGFETLRLGDSQTSDTNAFITVEHNLFECVDGEIEIISNKSCDNVFRDNTFIESAGTLTLRHGHRATVERNYFLGMGKDGSGGVRVIGEDHEIRHNYFADLDDRADAAISFAAGIRNTAPNGYQQVKRARIEHNTIVNVQGAGIRFDWGIGSRNRTLVPEELTLTKNLIVSTHAPLLEGQTDRGWAWTDNILFGADPGIDRRSGIRRVNPRMQQGPDGLWRPSDRGAGAQHGAALPSLESNPAADEQNLNRLAPPLTNKDVGPDWAR